MCGIAGYISRDPMEGEAMLAAIPHRGPDAKGRYSAVVDGTHVFLGHVRLSIIDLSAAGNQPMYACDDQIVLVFNGEIYNFETLRGRLLGGIAFRSHTDTEVILRLYEKFGIGFLEELNGDFAIAILDRRLGKFFLVRDRIGVKPVYFHESSGGFRFGSEIKAVLASGVEARLDEDVLQRFFTLKYSPGDETLFKGVRRLPPGHYIEIDVGSRRKAVHRYWTPDYSTSYAGSFDDAKRELRDLIEDATRIRLVADVPVGNFLSGGIDSSIIGGLLKGDSRITHYCARQSSRDTAIEGTTSDFSYASRLAGEWGLHLVPVDVGGGTITREQMRTTAFYGDDLIADSAQVPCYLITKGAAGTSKVFLSGMGADEILLGYPGHQLTLLAQYAERVPGAGLALRMLAQLDQGRGAFKAFRRYLYKLGKYRDLPEWRYALFTIVGDYANSAAVVRGGATQVDDFLAAYFARDSDPFESLKRFEFENFLQKNLSYVDRMSMANSVEVRVPYLDHRVVDFCYRLPRSFKLGAAGRTKKVLVEAFSDLLPRYVVNRRKAGFGMPIRSAFMDRAKVRDLVDTSALAGIADFDVPHIDRLIDAHVCGREDNSALLYALASFREWHAEFFPNASRKA